MNQPNSVMGAIAQRDQSAPASLIQQRRADFIKVLPDKSPDAVESWLRLAESAVNKTPQLQSAFYADTPVSLRALMLCASLGHVPGSERFALVPVKGKLEGWESYKGVLVRILNSGQYKKVVAEVVYTGENFEFDPNTDSVPTHKPNWIARAEGQPFMSYAYAIGHDDEPTKVAVADPGYIKRVKAAAQGASGTQSPWNKWPDDMHIKCAVKKLEAYVATSSKDLRGIGYVPSERITHISNEFALEEIIDGEVIDNPIELEASPSASFDGLEIIDAEGHEL